MSIDTGMSGNLFGGNYFTMNKGHLRGELNRIELNFRELEDESKQNYVLKIHSLKTKKKRIVRPIEEQLVDEKKIKKAPNKQDDDLDLYGEK
jgi:hypothetical protein